MIHHKNLKLPCKNSSTEGLVIMNNDFLPDRDGVWERFKESAKDTYNAQEIGWLQPMFFEAEFDYGNVDKYGRFAKDYIRAFTFSPVQNVEVWTRRFSKDLPAWLGDEYQYELSDILETVGAGQCYQVASFGWPFQLTVDWFHFCFGEEVESAEYKFLNYDVGIHPLFRSRLITLHERYPLAIRDWLKGNDKLINCFYVQTAKFWLSTLKWLHPVFFSRELAVGAKQAQCFLQDLFIEMRNSPNLSLDSEREVFLKYLVSYLESDKVPVDCNALWEASQQADFLHSKDVDSLANPDGFMQLNYRKISLWMKRNMESQL